MNLVIGKELLKKSLGMVEKVVGGKNYHLPILENVLLIAENHKLFCVCTDLETAIQTSCPVKIKNEGRVCVPVKLLSSLVQTLQGEKITIEQKETQIRIFTDSQKTTLKTFPITEYPIIPTVNKNQQISVEKEQLWKGLQQVNGISAPNDFKQELTGVYFHGEGKEIKIASTDTFRLAEKKIPIKTAYAEKYSFLIPARTASELLFVLTGKKGVCDIFIEPNQILFEESQTEEQNPQFSLVSRLIEGQFPNYEQIIPKKQKAQIRVNKEFFLQHIKTASLFSSNIKDIHVFFDPKEQQGVVSTKNPDFGEHTSSFSIEGKGEQFEVVLNWGFLIDGLQRIESSEVLIEYSEDGAPIVLRPIGDQTLFYVVMPIKNQ